MSTMVMGVSLAVGGQFAFSILLLGGAPWSLLPLWTRHYTKQQTDALGPGDRPDRPYALWRVL